tara:strand:- start:14038 stop:14259 length:222 start_codon:yes stop_codon:yes gene_type:complete
MNVRNDEAFQFNYWLIILKLLKLGIPWDFIENSSEAQIHMMLGVESAMAQKENEDNQAQASRGSMPHLDGMGF